jgi:hypothetical protein
MQDFWIRIHVFLFPNSAGTFSVGNWPETASETLSKKRQNSILPAGIPAHLIHTCKATTVKDMQRLRHTDPQTTLKHYAKVLPEPAPSSSCA